jgi:separase
VSCLKLIFHFVVTFSFWVIRYFGHGGGEQYVRSHKIRNLKRCAATMLWGCSSGALRDMGDFDRVGTPYNYMLAGW